MKKPIKASLDNIKQAAKIINQGGTVIFPTETVYGLGADALNSDAVIKIFRIKQRPEFYPLIIHIQNKNDIYRLCKNVNKLTEKLMKHFWPGSLTLVLEKSDLVPDIVSAGSNTVGIRMPSNKVALDLIHLAKTPIAGTSANRSGYLSPTNAQSAFEQIGNEVDFCLDDGETEKGIESTVISLVDEPMVLRLGSIEVERIERLIGKVIALQGSTTKLKMKTKFEFLLPNTLIPKKSNAGLLAFKKPGFFKRKFKKVAVLSAKGNLMEAAKNLFPKIYELDNAKLDKIYIDPIPEKEMGQAIMSRLRKIVQGD